MPLILMFRFLLSFLSLFILAAACYLLWTWYQGADYRDVYGVLRVAREDWRLWFGVILTVWSFGGGSLLLKPFLAKKDQEPLDPQRSDGSIIDGADGASLYVEETGPSDAPVIILTHGWGLDSTIWAYTRRHLAKSFRVIVWDLPTMGKSKAETKTVNLESFAKNLACVIAYSKSDRVVLVGHSIGGMTTQTLARDQTAFFNRHVAGVVLLNTTYRNPLSTMICAKLCLALRFPVIEPMMVLTKWLSPLSQLSAWKSYLDGSAHIANRLGFSSEVTHSQLEHTTLLSVRNPQGAQAQGNLAMFHWDATGAMSKVAVPLLIIGGNDDIVTKTSASRTIQYATPGANIALVDKANHMGFVECHAIYNIVINQFATETFSGGAATISSAQ